MEASQRNAIGMQAGIEALKSQRNEALDRLAQTQAELVATQAELTEARAQLAELSKPKEETASAGS